MVLQSLICSFITFAIFAMEQRDLFLPINKTIIEQCNTVKNQLEFQKSSDSIDEYFYIPESVDIEQKALDFITDFFSNLQEFDQQRQLIEAKNILESYLSAKFLTVQDLIKVLSVSNYLDSPLLLKICSEKLADYFTEHYYDTEFLEQLKLLPNELWYLIVSRIPNLSEYIEDSLKNRLANLTYNVVQAHSNSFPEIESIALSHDNKYLAVIGLCKTINIYRTDNLELCKQLTFPEDYGCKIAFDSSGNLYAASKLGRVRIWDNDFNELTKYKDPVDVNRGWISDLKITDNGNYLVIAAFENMLKIWDIKKKEPILYNSLSQNRSFTTTALSHDNNYIAGIKRDNKLKILSIPEGKELDSVELELETKDYTIPALVFSPNGSYLALADDHKIKILNAKDKFKEIASFDAHSSLCSINFLLFTSDNNYLLSASGLGTIKIWDTKKWQLLVTLDSGLGSIRSLALSENSQLFACTSKGYLSSWDISDMFTLNKALLTVDQVAQLFQQYYNKKEN